MEHNTLGIPFSVACAAHNGTSFVPEKRARQVQEGYSTELGQDFAALAKYADTDEKRELLEAEFSRYRAGYRQHVLAHLQSSSRIMSSMISGPSNFPVRQMEKRNNAEHKKYETLRDFRERALKAIAKKLQPELAPIMAGDADATERLKAKIAKAEQKQEIMKASNKAIRKHRKAGKVAQIAALVELGHSEALAHKIAYPDVCGGVGFQSYSLTNNNANIRRMKQRLERIEIDQATPSQTVEGEHARLEDCPADNRVRLFFPGKPDQDIRTKLKSNGFRWARSLGCWQAYRNHSSLDLANQIAGVPS